MVKKTMTVPEQPDRGQFKQEPLDEVNQQVPDNPSLRKEDYIANGKYSKAGSAGDMTQQVVPTLSAPAVPLSFRAASNQFNALTQFGSEGADAASIEDRARETVLRRKEYESIFLRDGVLEIDAHGSIREYLKYARAVEAIRAKAAALGYGAESQAVPITSVPGGYVGRFGGNDIYAAVQ